MEILIWGTQAKGKLVKRICDKEGWNVKAFIDNDASKWNKELEGIPVFAPNSICLKKAEDAQIWIATGASEVYGQAKKITDNVLGWEFVQSIIRGDKERPSYPEVQLNDYNIQNCMLVKDRDAFLKKFAAESSMWEMAEIGVAFGDFSETILRICSPRKLYLIDLWEGERFGAGLECIQRKFAHEIEEGTVEVRRGYSTQKLDELPDCGLDWIYIDTVHDYKTTKMELELSSKKVRKGGYICGHDYAKYNVYSRYDYGVYDAVNEFAVNEGYEFIYLTMENHGLQSFCLRKILGGQS